jgi:hypothetical protein
MIKMTCGICKGSGHIGPDGDMVTEQPCCQCNGSGVVFVVAPTQPATNTGSPKLPLERHEVYAKLDCPIIDNEGIATERYRDIVDDVYNLLERQLRAGA